MELEKKKSVQLTTLKVRLAPFFLSFFFFFYLMFLIRKNDQSIGMDIFMLGISLFFPVVGVLLYKFSKIEFDGEGIENRGLFRINKKLWKDINSAQLIMSPEYKNYGFELKFQLFNTKSFSIGLSIYSRKSIRILCEAIVSACPNADISDKIKNMAKGKFPWYIF